MSSLACDASSGGVLHAGRVAFFGRRGGSGTQRLDRRGQAAIWSRQPIATASHSPISSAALQTRRDPLSTRRSPAQAGHRNADEQVRSQDLNGQEHRRQPRDHLVSGWPRAHTPWPRQRRGGDERRARRWHLPQMLGNQRQGGSRRLNMTASATSPARRPRTEIARPAHRHSSGHRTRCSSYRAWCARAHPGCP